LEVEHNNIRAALRWAADRRDGEFGLRLAGALADFWVFRNYLREGRRWLEDARALGSETSSLVRARALAGEGILAVLQGDYPQARALLRDALALAESLRDPVLTAGVLARLGAVAVLQGDAGDAQALLERSLALRRGARAHEVVLALAGLGRAFVLLEDLERAEITMTEGLDVARTAGSPRQTAFALGNLARLKLKQQDYTAAAGLASEALQLARATQSRSTIKHVAGIAALLCARRGDVEHAARLLAAADPSSDWTGEAVSPTYHDPTVGVALHERARQQMGDAAYDAAVAEARAMSVDQVAELAQACLEPPTRSGPDGTAGTGEARSPALLSDREQAVLRLIAEGLPNKQIATALAIAERTVKTHVTSAMNKLGVDNRAHATVVAIRRGLL
jgi:non-specific serine/threonine protein kinase